MILEQPVDLEGHVPVPVSHHGQDLLLVVRADGVTLEDPEKPNAYLRADSYLNIEWCV